MSDPARFVSRWARVSEAFENPQHRGKYCEITSYRQDDDTYEVQICNTYQTDPRKSVRVKLSDLDFIYEKDFAALFPEAPVVDGNSTVMGQLPVGTVVDISKSDRNRFPLDPKHPIKVSGACRVVGDHTAISNRVFIDLEDNDVDIVEFEHIDFESVLGYAQRIDCFCGHIVFRSCAFDGNQVAVEIGFSDDAQLRVVFENCSFRRHKESAVRVNSGHVTFINCRFINNGVAVALIEDTSVDVVHCHFVECTAGVLLPSKGEAHIRHCIFATIADFGVLATNGSEAHVDWCVFKYCNEGMVVEGRDDTYLNAVRCRTEHCKMGVRIGNGKVQVILKHIGIHESKFGVYVAVDTAGTVDADNCNFVGCAQHLVNLSGMNCGVAMDGMGQERDTQLESLQIFNDLMTTLGIKYGYPVSAEGKRALCDAGLLTVCCANCKVDCPTGAWYKKCARCREVRYCSRACQVAHYSAHHTECVVTFMRFIALVTRGYIKCNQCGLVEVQSSDKPHSACSRCLKVFYCSRQCQVANWKGHKKECKPYKDIKYNT